MRTKHIDGDESRLIELLSKELSTPFQVPYLHLSKYPEVYVVHGEDSAITISVDGKDTHLSSPIGKFSSELIEKCFIHGLIKDKIYLDGWTDPDSTIDLLFEGIDTLSNISQSRLTLLCQDPRLFPVLKGKKNQSLRTALNKQKKHDLKIRRLNKDDLPSMLNLSCYWIDDKVAKEEIIPQDKYSSYSQFIEVLTSFNLGLRDKNYAAYGIFDANQRLVGINAYMTFGQTAVPLFRIFRSNNYSAQEALDIYVTKTLKEEGITWTFKGIKEHQRQDLRRYHKKFGPVFENVLTRYVIKTK